MRDIFQVCDERIGDERFDSISYILNDFSEVEAIKGNTSDIKNALIYSNQSSLFSHRENILVAFIASNEQIRSFIRIFFQEHASTPHSWERALFECEADADRWASEKLQGS